MNYSITRARDGSIIGPVNRSGRTSRSSEDPSQLPSVESLVNQVIDGQLSLLSRDVAPYTIRITRSLEREPNSELRPLMNSARQQVRSGSYRVALQSYLDIYNEHKNIAAAINAAILYEALGEIHTAISFMQEVHAATGNPRASEKLSLLNREVQEMSGVAEFSETQRAVDRLANHAINEIQRILPANARVWIHNNAATDQSMLNDIIDNMTSNYIRRGVIVVERARIDLITNEQNFQLQGNVSDNDFVSIGNMAGANIILLINITGTGGARRLQVRVLDIERGIPIFQSDAGEAWSI